MNSPISRFPMFQPVLKCLFRLWALYCVAMKIFLQARIQAVRKREVHDPVGATEEDGGLGSVAGQRV